MASKIAEKAPGWFSLLLLPEIMEMKGKLKALNVKIDAASAKIDATREELLSKVDSLRNELIADIGKVDSSVKDLDKRLDMDQRLAVLEAKQREFEKKSS